LAGGTLTSFKTVNHIGTPIEIEYYRDGGIFFEPYLKKLLGRKISDNFTTAFVLKSTKRNYYGLERT
jgi:hypothetical protein